MIIGNSNNFRYLTMGSGGGDKTDPPAQVPQQQPVQEEKDSTENKV